MRIKFSTLLTICGCILLVCSNVGKTKAETTTDPQTTGGAGGPSDGTTTSNDNTDSGDTNVTPNTTDETTNGQTDNGNNENTETTNPAQDTSGSTGTDSQTEGSNTATPSTQPTTVADACASNPCINGTCSINSETGNYTCTCDPDFTGPNCETVIDNCDPNPCFNQTMCTDEIEDYTCDCPPTLQGKNCTEDVKECDNATTCANGGYCQELHGGFKCYCTAGWEGVHCDKDIDECKVHCKGIGYNCTNTNGSYICECLPGYQQDGAKCEEILILHDKEDSILINNENTISDPFYIPERFSYFGNPYEIIYVSTNGYMTIGNKLSMLYPPRNLSDWKTTENILAPYWWYNDIPENPSAGLKLSTWSYTNEQDKDMLQRITDIVKDHNFKAEFVFMATWHHFTPYPADKFADKMAITFQVILATNGQQSYAIMNYDELWPSSSERFVTSLITGSRIKPIDSFTPGGRMIRPLYDNDESVANKNFDCAKVLHNLKTEYQKQNITPADTKLCPCTLDQVVIDIFFKMNSETNDNQCYIQVLAFDHDAHLVCCYNKKDKYLIGSPPDAGYAQSKYEEVKNLQKTSHDVCCDLQSSMCSTYAQQVPPITCSYYNPHTAFAFGDPHFSTLDGSEYTFNGWGEYHLLKQDDLEIQVRTDIISNGDENATQIISITARMTDGPIIEYMKASNGDLEYYIDGKKQINDTMTDMMIISKVDTSYKTIFSNKLALMIKPVESYLSLQVMGYPISTKGLLGVANGNRTDDFLLMNGTTLPSDATEEQHFDFGNSWVIQSEEDSLFNYTLTEQNFTTNQHPEYIPRFYRDLAQNLTELFNGDENMINMTLEICQSSMPCTVDYAVTNNTDFANSTKMIHDGFIKDGRILGNKPPLYTEMMPVFYWFINSTIDVLESTLINVTDDHDQDITVTIRSNIDSQWISYNHTTNMLYLNTSGISEGKYIKLMFSDEDGATSILDIRVILCLCHQKQQCVQHHNWQTTVLKCNCPDDMEGRYCEKEKDVCYKCYDVSFCNTTDVTNPCSCPTDLEGDGINCYDLDECITGDHICDHHCINQIPGYKCSCKPGYMLQDKGTCIDIDECRENTDNCSASEDCVNTPGSFTCPCRSMYKRDDNGECRKVVAIYGGNMMFPSVPGTSQQWQPELENKDTSQFKTLSENVITFIKESLSRDNNTKESVISISVVKFTNLMENRRRKRSTNSQDIISSEYEASFNKVVSDADLKKALDDYIDTCINQCNNLIDVDKSTLSLSGDYDLCKTDNNNCQTLTTNCTSSNGTFECICKGGYEDWPGNTHACKDINECEGSETNTTILQMLCGEQGIQCVNEPGSYSCQCSEDYIWNKETKCTLRNYCVSEPCRNGATCVNVYDANFACKCRTGYSGQMCEIEDGMSKRERDIIIAVSVTLGCLCLILIIGLICVCVRKSRKNKYHHSINMNEYSTFKGIPRAQLRGQDNPMMENESNGVRQSHEI